jgi:hypothetical protein
MRCRDQRLDTALADGLHCEASVNTLNEELEGFARMSSFTCCRRNDNRLCGIATARVDCGGDDDMTQIQGEGGESLLINESLPSAEQHFHFGARETMLPSIHILLPPS